MKLEKILEQYGLNKKQAKVYLACLELGSASVYKISHKASLPRSTCYEIIDSLKNLNLVSYFQKKNVKTYAAENPQKIIERTKEKAKMLEEALPQFNAVYGSSKTNPKARFYKGKDGIKIILEEMLDEAKEILAFSSAEDYFYALEDYWPKFLELRIKKRIPIKNILRESPKTQERKRLGPEQLREVKIIPSKYEHHGVTTIWKNKTAMFSFQKELTALVIESDELSQIQKAMFNFMWDSLEK